MSIIDSFVKDGKPAITVCDVYEKSDVLRAFIVTFSFRTIDALLDAGRIELISENSIRSISCNYPVYRFIGTDIGFVKTTVGAPITSGILEEISYVYSCRKAVLFGTCGTLDRSIPKNMVIVSTHAYRDEGTSYYYMEPSDYIEMKHYRTMCEIFDSCELCYGTNLDNGRVLS